MSTNHTFHDEVHMCSLCEYQSQHHDDHQIDLLISTHFTRMD